MGKPAVFSDLDHASALEAARGQGKQLLVDAEPATAKQLDIRAMPTVIAFRDGIEFDRSVGLKQRCRSTKH